MIYVFACTGHEREFHSRVQALECAFTTLEPLDLIWLCEVTQQLHTQQICHHGNQSSDSSLQSAISWPVIVYTETQSGLCVRPAVGR